LAHCPGNQLLMKGELVQHKTPGSR
jgi:hypothetical protein